MVAFTTNHVPAFDGFLLSLSSGSHLSRIVVCTSQRFQQFLLVFSTVQNTKVTKTMADKAAQQKEVESTVEEVSETTKPTKPVVEDAAAEENGDKEAEENGREAEAASEPDQDQVEDESNDSSAKIECTKDSAQKRKSAAGADAPDSEGATPEKKAKLAEEPAEATAESNGKVEVSA